MKQEYAAEEETVHKLRQTTSSQENELKEIRSSILSQETAKQQASVRRAGLSQQRVKRRLLVDMLSLQLLKDPMSHEAGYRGKEFRKLEAECTRQCIRCNHVKTALNYSMAQWEKPAGLSFCMCCRTWGNEIVARNCHAARAQELECLLQNYGT